MQIPRKALNVKLAYVMILAGKATLYELKAQTKNVFRIYMSRVSKLKSLKQDTFFHYYWPSEV